MEGSGHAALTRGTSRKGTRPSRILEWRYFGMLRNLSRSVVCLVAGVAAGALWPMTAQSQVPNQAPPPAGDDQATTIEPPRALAPLAVDYPADATGEASVELALTIDAEGNVKSATVTRGEEPFAAAARDR